MASIRRRECWKRANRPMLLQRLARLLLPNSHLLCLLLVSLLLYCLLVLLLKGCLPQFHRLLRPSKEPLLPCLLQCCLPPSLALPLLNLSNRRKSNCLKPKRSPVRSWKRPPKRRTPRTVHLRRKPKRRTDTYLWVCLLLGVQSWRHLVRIPTCIRPGHYRPVLLLKKKVKSLRTTKKVPSPHCSLHSSRQDRNANSSSKRVFSSLTSLAVVVAAAATLPPPAAPQAHLMLFRRLSSPLHHPHSLHHRLRWARLPHPLPPLLSLPCRRRPPLPLLPRHPPRN